MSAQHEFVYPTVAEVGQTPPAVTEGGQAPLAVARRCPPPSHAAGVGDGVAAALPRGQALGQSEQGRMTLVGITEQGR
jgi:hypothetical protein